LATSSTICCSRARAAWRFIGRLRWSCAVVLRLDHHHAFGRDALVGLRQQARLDVGWQRRSRHVEAQVRGAGDLVDVLPTRALRTHGGEVDFSRIQHHPSHDAQED